MGSIYRPILPILADILAKMIFLIFFFFVFFCAAVTFIDFDSDISGHNRYIDDISPILTD